jgi:hypothetical protein
MPTAPDAVASRPMNAAAVLSLMLLLVPRWSTTRLRPHAEAIAAVAESPQEGAVLAVIAFAETGFGRDGVPFGLTCCKHPGWTLEQYAGRAAEVFRAGFRACGARAPLEILFHRYHTGHCRPDRVPLHRHGRPHVRGRPGAIRPDRFAELEARHVRRLWRALARTAPAAP